MCTFQIKVVLCHCTDPSCRQRSDEVADNQLWEPGHTIRITQYYRISGICLGWFRNTDPSRTVVKYGLREWNTNSRQDCSENKRLVLHPELTRSDRLCEACQSNCTQPSPPLEENNVFVVGEESSEEERNIQVTVQEVPEGEGNAQATGGETAEEERTVSAQEMNDAFDRYFQTISDDEFMHTRGNEA
ncbi:hypothetical protein ACRE_031860 [Hapsidospora chrysogenum ATCC 11550]|uniref:Uncharacterized protein n=1 Tax=Hapsidospora chrysogenum (strain ATCC 11550 / CBS 779.69 / DSM 880 / IAM 14645 / JCM 23072 / IMI 49137) TaxID=857340 RepID=A0A086T9L6_HAPC1|nr:hypothetical protein ACRE_031860 [Hapsidospora chrysogenum ATCC 11550]